MDGEAEDVIVAFYSRAALFFSNLFLILGPNGRKSPHSLRQEPMNITVWEKKKKTQKPLVVHEKQMLRLKAWMFKNVSFKTSPI